jgi:hypothetical protein
MMENAQAACMTVAWTKIIELHIEAMRHENVLCATYGTRPLMRTAANTGLFPAHAGTDKGTYSSPGVEE